MARIAYFYRDLTEYIEIDLRLLRAQHAVDVVCAAARWPRPLATWRTVARADAVMSWFASWHALLPALCARLQRKPFVLVAGGYCCLFLAAFYMVIEIWQWRRWAQPFVWIGMNSITIYMIHNIVDMEKLSQRFAGGQLNETYFGRYGTLVLAVLALAISFWICRFLYRRGIFLRL